MKKNNFIWEALAVDGTKVVLETVSMEDGEHLLVNLPSGKTLRTSPIKGWAFDTLQNKLQVRTKNSEYTFIVTYCYPCRESPVEGCIGVFRGLTGRTMELIQKGGRITALLTDEDGRMRLTSQVCQLMADHSGVWLSTLNSFYTF